MASHFKEPEEKPRRGRDAAAAAHTPVSTPAHRGGDESYHAPVGNPHAAANAGRAAQGFVPVTSANADAGSSRHGRRTDPYDLSGRRENSPKRRRNRIISGILFALGIILILLAAGMWGYNQWQYHEQDQINEKLAAYATIDPKGSEAPVVDWASLKAVNQDVVGWVQIPNTVVNFPVYQGADNDEYLHTNAEGSYSLGGQIFLDAENAAPGMQDAQSIIYGHHLRNGAMFKPIADMENQEYFDSVDTVWYVTEDANYELEPLMLYKTDENDANVRQFSFAFNDDFHTYLAGLLGKAVAKRSDADALIAGADKVLTLCTCNYTNNETGRTILVCVPKASAAADAAATSN